MILYLIAMVIGLLIGQLLWSYIIGPWLEGRREAKRRIEQLRYFEDRDL